VDPGAPDRPSGGGVGSLPGQGEAAGLRVVDLEDAVIDVVDLRIADAP
jgi:hypothetical protein